MQKSEKQPTGDAAESGLRCWKCGHDRFRVLYTRPVPGGKVLRRRACRQCNTRCTTHERVIG